MEGEEDHPSHSSAIVHSSSFKMKPMQITAASADPLQQPKQYGESKKDHPPKRVCPTLPIEMCLEVLSHLDARTLVSCSAVCRMWLECCKDEVLWKTLFECNLDAQVFVKVRSAAWYVL